MTASLIKALRPFASCDIGDALVKLKYPMGGFLDGISMWSPTRAGTSAENTTIIGEVTTVKMVPASDTTSPTPATHFADSNQPGKIMYIQQPRDALSACFGGLMATRAQQLRAAGVVIDGRFRDVLEIQEMGLPLFARTPSTLGSASFTRAASLDVPVHFRADLWIHPGDIMIGDHDGVVVVPPALGDKVVEMCAARKEVDARVLEALRGGVGMGEAMGRYRK